MVTSWYPVGGLLSRVDEKAYDEADSWVLVLDESLSPARSTSLGRGATATPADAMDDEMHCSSSSLSSTTQSPVKDGGREGSGMKFGFFVCCLLNFVTFFEQSCSLKIAAPPVCHGETERPMTRTSGTGGTSGGVVDEYSASQILRFTASSGHHQTSFFHYL